MVSSFHQRDGIHALDLTLAKKAQKTAWDVKTAVGHEQNEVSNMPQVVGVDVGDDASGNVACWENFEPCDERFQVAVQLSVNSERAREVKVEDSSNEPRFPNLGFPTSIGNQTNQLKWQKLNEIMKQKLENDKKTKFNTESFPSTFLRKFQK